MRTKLERLALDFQRIVAQPTIEIGLVSVNRDKYLKDKLNYQIAAEL